MKIFYRRSGGFIGMRQSLQIDNGKHLVAQDRNQTISTRDLTPEEAQQLTKLLEKMRSAMPAEGKGKAVGISDSFTVYLKVEGGPDLEIERATLSTESAGAGPPWDEVFHWFDAKMTEEVRKANPGAPHILSGDELRNGD